MGQRAPWPYYPNNTVIPSGLPPRITGRTMTLQRLNKSAQAAVVSNTVFIRPMIRRPWNPIPRTKQEVDRMTRCWDMAIRSSTSVLREREGYIGSHRSYHWKERWWFPI